MRTPPRVSLALAATSGIIASLALAGIVQAAEVTLSADLTGTAEGANAGDPDGSGSATIVVDVAAGTLCWELDVADIEPVTQSHIHVGAAGVAGDVVVPLDVDGFDGTSEGCIEPMEDAAILQQIVDDPGAYYVNVHTADYPPGAIRGQLAAETPNTALPLSDSRLPVLLGTLLLAVGLAIGLRTWRPLAARG